MGLYFKVAPGVRIRLTGRGVRASIGPRVARVHIGAGGPGVSTGAGAVSLYHRLGTPSPRSARPCPRKAVPPDTVPPADTREAVYTHLLQQYMAPPLLNELAPPVPMEPVDERAIAARALREALQEVPAWNLRARLRARRQARAAAPDLCAAAWRTATKQHQEERAAVVAAWDALSALEPETTQATLTAAFTALEIPAVCTEVDGAHASLLLWTPDLHVVPERSRTWTPTGRPSTHLLTKTARNQAYTELICAQVLFVARHAFATVPALPSLQVAAIHHQAPDAYGVVRAECVALVTIERRWLEGVQWGRSDPEGIVHDAATKVQINRSGSTREVKPLDLTDEPDLTAMLASVQLESDSQTTA